VKKESSNILPMFTECEFTGRMMPNIRLEPVWILFNRFGQAMGQVNTHNEAIQRMSIDEDIYGYEKM